MTENEIKITPILKWGGGKRQLLTEILPLIPSYTRYYEPFVGGAAVLLGLQPYNAVINDYNEELINTYRVIKKNPQELIEQLRIHKEHNSEEYFYQVRSWDRDLSFFSEMSDIERAARTVYLNRTCYNGLYRVNRNGYFNTPYGKYNNPEIINKERIIAIHQYFINNKIDIRYGDYKESLKDIRPGAFVYFAPPYMPPETGEETFTQYTVDGFDEIKQIELKDVCDILTKKNVKFMLSNSYCTFIRNLYKDYNIKKVQASRKISANAEKRGFIDEVLVTNYDV